MRGIRRDHPGGLGHLLRRFLQILEIDRTHRLADPIAGGDRGDCPADVVERLENLRRDIVRAILVTDDRRDRDLRIARHPAPRSEEHTSELQSIMRISSAVFCLQKKNYYKTNYRIHLSLN